jgi:hypothetical protein
LVRASNQTYITCFRIVGEPGCPTGTDVREMLRSWRPASTNVRTSFSRKAGLQEVRIRRIEIEQRLLILREPEIVALLLQPFDLVPAGRAPAVHELCFGDEDFVHGAVPALVVALVDVAVGGYPPPDLLGGAEMARLRSYG